MVVVVVVVEPLVVEPEVESGVAAVVVAVVVAAVALSPSARAVWTAISPTMTLKPVALSAPTVRRLGAGWTSRADRS